MMQVDMVTFQASGDGIVTDLWSPGYYKPTTDAQNDFSDIEITKNADNSYTFSAMRELDTGDSSQDSAIACGKTHSWQWVAHSTTAQLQKHNKKGSFSLKLADDCSTNSTASDSSSSSESSSLYSGSQLSTKPTLVLGLLSTLSALA
eukprot:CAMPEP_0168613840 /NCGR_PEP_ID=MMETSP0449_2-20121227/3660_1 /TAXON_ID=1082188 /ORGANISM="Strombidium rassoulzadegani, Strain ras09" /LENGTH=146 /DNA_ID=CAMNT_0008654489 /DNA_START=153 /DNA_END=589 /DNA_ORIENTATION=+